MMEDSNSKHTFWLNDPSELVKHLSLLPVGDMSFDEKLNSLTRLVVVIAVVLWVLEYEYWLVFLMGGLLTIIIVKYISTTSTNEKFSIPPTYVDGASPMTTVPPLFAEEWQIPPPAYDLMNMEGVDNPYTEAARESQEGLSQVPYPVFSQYITDTTILPHEEEEFKNRSLQDVQVYATDAYTRDTLQFRNDMIRPFVNRLNREYKHGCFDQLSPYSSW